MEGSITAKIAFIPAGSLFEGSGRLLATKFNFREMAGIAFSRRWAAILAWAQGDVSNDLLRKFQGARFGALFKTKVVCNWTLLPLGFHGSLALTSCCKSNRLEVVYIRQRSWWLGKCMIIWILTSAIDQGECPVGVFGWSVRFDSQKLISCWRHLWMITCLSEFKLKEIWSEAEF